MRITRADARQLVVVDFPWLIPVLCFPTACVMLAVGLTAITRALHKPGFAWFGTGSGEIWGPLMGGLLAGAIGMAFCVRSEFSFDLVERRLTWSRRSVLRASGGSAPFEQVGYAFTERSSDGETFRVTLRTDAGSLPLSPIYSSNHAHFDKIRDAINAALDIPAGDRELMETEILELALAGKKNDAIAAARKRYGYDLAQAKQFVESLAR